MAGRGVCRPTNAFDWRSDILQTLLHSASSPRARQAAVSFHTPPYDKMISPATVGVIMHGGNLVTCGLLPRENVQANPQPLQSCVLSTHNNVMCVGPLTALAHSLEPFGSGDPCEPCNEQRATYQHPNVVLEADAYVSPTLGGHST